MILSNWTADQTLLLKYLARRSHFITHLRRYKHCPTMFEEDPLILGMYSFLSKYFDEYACLPSPDVYRSDLRPYLEFVSDVDFEKLSEIVDSWFSYQGPWDDMHVEAILTEDMKKKTLATLRCSLDGTDDLRDHSKAVLQAGQVFSGNLFSEPSDQNPFSDIKASMTEAAKLVCFSPI